MPTSSLSPELQRALAAIGDATVGMTDEQLIWHPEGKWSSAEILEHLALAYSLTAVRMQPLLQQDIPETRKRTFQDWIGQIIVLRWSFIPRGRKAPQPLIPRGMNPADAKSGIEEKLAQLDMVIEQCEKRFGNKRKVLDHTVLGPLSTSEWRRFHCVHTLHHMKQIHALRRWMGETNPAVDR